MLLPELTTDEDAARQRIEQLAAQVLELEAINKSQVERIGRLQGALEAERNWRRRLWDENQALKAALEKALMYWEWADGQDLNEDVKEHCRSLLR